MFRYFIISFAASAVSCANALSTPAFTGKLTAKISISKQAGDIRKPEALLFEGGGTLGVTYGGVVQRLSEAGLLGGIKKFAGTSAGSQAAALLAFGHTPEEYAETLRTFPYAKTLDDDWGIFSDLWRLINAFGFYKGDALEKALDEAFAKKAGKLGCTLQEQYELTGNELRIGACCITTGKFEFIDRIAHPDMPVALACRMSSAIPFAFVPVEWKGKVYVDGGLLGNLPTSAYPGIRALACNLISQQELAKRDGKALNDPRNIIDFTGTVLNIMLQAAQEKNGKVMGMEENGIDVIDVKYPPGAGLLDVSMSEEEFQALVDSGRAAVDEYLA